MTPSKPKLNVVDFAGTVVTMDWIRMPDGRMYSGLAGRISIFSAKEAVGWEPTGHNSANWMARIQGAKTSVNLMGCQVRAVIEGDTASCGDIYVVP